MRPQNFLHASGFKEVQDSVAWSLAELGHEVNCSENRLETGARNIIFGAELLNEQQALPKGSIIFNLEQPSHPSMAKVHRLAKDLIVWDYSKRNVEEWKSQGVEVYHVPIGFTPNLVRIPHSDEKDWDCCFFGFLTPRRNRIINELREAGLKVFASDCCYGGGRDYVISRSRVCLNIHHDGRDMFEIVRVSYLLANDIRVVSECSIDDNEYRDLQYSFDCVPTDWLVGICKQAVTDKPEAYGDKFRRRDFTSTIRNTLLEMRYTLGCKEGDMKDFLPWLREKATGKRVGEIGVRDGASTSAILPVAKMLWSVDVDDCSTVAKGHPRWRFIHKSSRDIFVDTENGFMDMILIDGDHTREGFRSDLERLWPSLISGGIMCCHDLRPEFTLEDYPGSDFPSKYLRDEFYDFAKKHNIPAMELPGRFGMGVLTKP